jgi:hypothetical protein
MATFGELIIYVSKRLLDANNTSVSQQDVAASLNDAVDYWKFTRFWFNEKTFAGVTTTGSETLPLPSDFVFPAYDDGAFIISYSDQRYPLKKVGQAEYDAMFMTNGLGLPQVYARSGQNYLMYPIPDRDYDVISRYLKNYDRIAFDNFNATNDFIEYAPRLISLWACANLIAEIRQDDKMESYFRNAAIDEKSNLLKRTRKENATGTLTTYM